jgi:hypothetical protein
MQEKSLKFVGTVWQSAHSVHLPGECRLPAEIGKKAVWLKVDGVHAVVV